MPDLVTVSPEEILHPDVLIWVFDTVFQRRQMFPMLPMLIPQVPGIDRPEDQARGNDTAQS